MFFSNLTFFRFPAPADHREFFREAHKGAVECQLNPVGPMELSSRGFISPVGSDSTVLAYMRDDKLWLTVGGEDRIIPGAVVNDLLAKKLREIEKAEGRKPGGRTRKRIKDELIVDLLPRSFVKPSRVDGYLDLGRGLLVVNTASRKAAEGFVSEVRRALGSFPALPLNAEVSPRAVLTDWIANGPTMLGLSLGEDATLRDPMEKGAVVRVSKQELGGEEIEKHLESGKQVSRLGMYFGEHDQNDHVSFTIDEDLVVRKFKLLDSALDSLEGLETSDLQVELDARFFLLTQEVGQLFDVLAGALKYSKVEA